MMTTSFWAYSCISVNQAFKEKKYSRLKRRIQEEEDGDEEENEKPEGEEERRSGTKKIKMLPCWKNYFF